MSIYLDHAYASRGRRREDVDAAVEYGAVERVRPKMMTVTATMA